MYFLKRIINGILLFNESKITQVIKIQNIEIIA